MRWFLVKIVYQIICGDGKHTPQFDEQLRLVSATAEEEALQRAALIGMQEEEVFRNDKQQLVQWKFAGITELHALNDFIDGAEVFSMIKETGDAEAYSNFIQHKFKQLRERFAQQHLQIA